MLKRYCGVALVGLGIQGAGAFSMLGPFDTWMVEQLSYLDGGALGGPMNLGEEFRWNIPMVNYAFDQSFLDYFGSNGVYAVEQAIAILNGLTNVSAYSADLSEVPLEATRYNHRAEALGVLDLKSVALHLLVEQLALADPVRYTWTLRARALPPGATCPNYEYLVIKRNFDPVTWEHSSYVNGTLYSYRIREYCPDPDQAEAVEFLVDPLTRYYTAVASPSVPSGAFFTGLTRDDVGGLRYLLRTNNYNFEDPPQDSTIISGGVTNSAARQLLYTSNLTTLLSQALTNNAATLQALYPSLLISGTTTYFTNVVVTNAIAYFTNFPWSPAGSPATLIYATNYTTNVAARFLHSFVNVITNTFYTNGVITLLETNLGPCGPWSPPGTICTNVTAENRNVAMIMGDYYLSPPDLCGYFLVATQLIQVLAETNFVLEATSADGQAFSQGAVNYFTNHIFVVDPVECGANVPALRQGAEKISFIRRSYDSLLGRYFEPATNRFQLTMVTNNSPIQQTFERVALQPDILFAADDLVSDPTSWPFIVPRASRSLEFNSNNAALGLPGPGLVLPSSTITFEKVGPVRFNSNPYFIDEATSSLIWNGWGTFDGSTNPPILYPHSTSIVDLENQVLINLQREVEWTNSVATTNWVILTDGLVLETGTLNQPYPQPGPPLPASYPVRVSFTVSGGQPPYTWLPGAGGGLPPGLSVVPDPANGARCTLSGTPAGPAGTYDFVLRLEESSGRHVERNLTLTINP